MDRNRNGRSRLRGAAGPATLGSLLCGAVLLLTVGAATVGAQTIAIPASGDTYLKSGSPNQNQGSEGVLRVQSSGHNRALVKFDPSAIAAAVGSGSLVSARLELSIASNPGNWGAEGRTVDAHRLTVAWTEPGATWNCPFDTNPANGSPDCAGQWSGGAFEEEPSDTVVHTSDLAGWIGFDVTADVGSLLAGGDHHGWLVKKTEEGQPGRVDYTSREAGATTAPRLVLVVESAEHDETRPRLAITSPESPVVVNDPSPAITLEYSDGGSGVDTDSLEVLVDTVDVGASCSAAATLATCSPGILAPGPHTIDVALSDHAGNLATATLSFEILSGAGLHTLRLAVTADTYLRQGAPNQNQGAETVVRVRQSGRNRALVSLDAAEAASLLAGTTVHSARLELSISDNGDNWGVSGRTVDLHRVTVPWFETGATWNCAADSDPTNQQRDCSPGWSGGSFAAPPVGSVRVTNGLGGRVDFDVTAEVAAMAVGGTHEGWLIKKTDEGRSGLIEFVSREGAAEERPGVVVVFETAAGGDDTPPVITPVTPEAEAFVSTGQPQITATFSDLGVGVDGASARLFVDGVERTAEAEAGSSGISYSPVDALAEEIHVVLVSVQDHAGNRAQTTWWFTVDTIPPAIVLTAPSSGQLVNEDEVLVIGEVNDASGVVDLTINGLPVSLAGEAFESSVQLSEGLNPLGISAIDPAGNTGSLTVEVERFSLPEIAIASPADLSILASTVVDVSGTVGAGIASVLVNGVLATVTDTTFVAAGVPLIEGGNVLTAAATDSFGHVATDSVSVVRDLVPPRLAIYGPEEGTTVFEPTVAVRGLINDIVAGTVNASEATVTVGGLPAEVANRSFLLVDYPLQSGANPIEVVAVDEAGNTTRQTVVVHRAVPERAWIAVAAGDHQSAPIGSLLPQPLVAELRDAEGLPVAGRPVFFRVIGSNGTLDGGLRQVAVPSGADGRASASFTLGTRAGVGGQLVEATAVGFEGPAVFVASATPGEPSLIVVDAGGQQLGLAGRELPRPLIATVTDAGFNRLADVPVRFKVAKGDGSLTGGSSEIVVLTDSDGRAIVSLTLDAAEGISNNVVEATIDGLAESPVASFVATGRAGGPAEKTSISGVVLDNTNHPIAGVMMRIRDTALAVQSDAQGLFRIEGAPVGTVYLIADGSTAERPGSWPDLEFVLTTVPGRDNDIGMPIFLLPLNLGAGLLVDETHGGTLTLPEMPGFALEVAPGSVTFPGGSRSGMVSVTAVHGDKVPMVPNFGQQPRLIVTIQPAGARFEPPARLVLPNVEGLAPGEVTEFYSFDHDLGHFVSVGPATVSDDGLLIASNPGVGIIKAGWHCGGNPSPSGTPHKCPACQRCILNECLLDPTKENDECKESETDNPGKVCISGECTCAIPVGFRQDNAAEIGPGHLRFTYSWGSNSGEVKHLKDCRICERVDYPLIPFPPPFPPLSPPNPTIRCVPGNANASADGASAILFDDILSPGQFVQPYFESSIASVQRVFYGCPCVVDENGIGKPVFIFGPIRIERSVTRNPDGTFKYTVSKSGASSNIDPLP